MTTANANVVHTNTVETDSRCSTQYLWNEDNTIRVSVSVRPGKMTLKLERQGGQMEFATRHGHTLDEVRARATQMVEMRSLQAARRLFRNQA